MKYDTPAAEKALSKPCETKGPSTLIFLFTRCPFERNIWHWVNRKFLYFFFGDFLKEGVNLATYKLRYLAH